MPTRRTAMTMIGVSAILPVVTSRFHLARAGSGDQATTFVKSTCDRLIAIANSGALPAAMRPLFREVLVSAVDIEDTARFCLGRFWGTATLDQQKAFTAQFREFLVTKIVSHLGKYQGVQVTMGLTRAQEDNDVVVTMVDRPGTPTSQIDWVLSGITGSPKIVDLFSEGVSLRVTHHSDFTSYLSRNSVDALIGLMRKRNEQTS
jgi:phospholipid transport system substrate-binding protein